MDKFLLEQENKIIRLVEERGVAAFPYKNIISNILKYCQFQSKELKPNDKIKFSIPNSLTSKIDFVKDLKINVFIEDGENFAYKTGGGNLEVKMSDKIINGKYSSGTINIYGFSFYGKIYDRTILNSLYHELNHFYECWQELIKNGNMNTFAFSSKRSKIEINSLPSPYKEKINLIIYRLFSNTELNALISSVYGDLESIKSERLNFHIDIKITQAYDLYLYIKENLNKIIYFLENNPQYIKPFFNELDLNNIKINPYYKNERGYLKEFKRKTNFQLKLLLKGIGKVASLYYDNKEVPEDNFNIKIN